MERREGDDARQDPAMKEQLMGVKVGSERRAGWRDARGVPSEAGQGCKTQTDASRHDDCVIEASAVVGANKEAET
jgi:hypothetical protein